MKKLVKGFASVILASMFVFIGCNQTSGGSKSPTGTSDPTTGGSKPTSSTSKPADKGTITVTVKGDDGIEIQTENTFTADKNTKWGDIKDKADAKKSVKENYDFVEWRLNDKTGNVLNDDTLFTKNETVFAISKEKEPVTVTVKGDERIESEQAFKIPYGSEWSNIREDIGNKIKPSADWKVDWNKGDYAVYEWRVDGESGAKISDDYRFTKSTTVYAVSNYVNWKIKDGYFSDTKVLSGVNGSKPRGKIILPDSVKTYRVTSIEKNAFYHCSSLTGIIIPNSVKTIGEGAFWGCSALTGITIPNSVKTIEKYAFSDCSSLTGITILDGVTSIGHGAFSNCSALTGIIIPKSVEKIEIWAFGDCNQLTSVSFADPVGWAAYDNDTYTLENAKIDESKLAKPDATDEEKEKTAKLLTDTYASSYWGKRLW